MNRSAMRPSPALVLAFIALLVAVGGTAVALPGKNSVDKNDIRKNAVKSKAIKNGQVKAADIASGGVRTAEIADGAVTSSKLAKPEASHLVGAAGEPAFGNGGDNDCVWQNLDGNPDFAGIDHVSFFIDPFGIVHLSGTAVGLSGTGGDQLCASFGVGAEQADGIVFTLPAGYRPTGLQTSIYVNNTRVWIVPSGGAEIENVQLPGGTVFAESGFAILDGITYRAAP